LVTPNATNRASAGETARPYNNALHKRANNPKTFPESGGLRIRLPKGGMTMMPDIQILEVS